MPTTGDPRLDRRLGAVEANNWVQSTDRVSTILPTAVKAAVRIRDNEVLSVDSGSSAYPVATDIAGITNLTTGDRTGLANLNSTAPPLDPSAGGGSLVQQVSHAIEAWRGSLAEHGTARFAAWLTPPNLGQVWVELTRSGGGITARISASDDSVQSLLNAQSPGLRQALADSGINITALDVSGRSGGDATSQRQQQQSDERAEHETLPPLRFTASARRALAANPGVVDVRV
ncbi:MAG: flagellar hook-length control protein FliK [Planctomycetaceae bacterium]